MERRGSYAVRTVPEMAHFFIMLTILGRLGIILDVSRLSRMQGNGRIIAAEMVLLKAQQPAET